MDNSLKHNCDTKPIFHALEHIVQNETNIIYKSAKQTKTKTKTTSK